MPNSCCSPSNTSNGAPPRAGAIKHVEKCIQSIEIPGGNALVGTDSPQIHDDGEEPSRTVRIKPFRIDQTTVTNSDFAKFTDVTGYVTDAERLGWSFVFWSDVSPDIPYTQGIAGYEWWRRVDGANWRDILGPGSSGNAWFSDHPVVHVSWNDAVAYAQWAGGRLATEAEWEHAARGGLGDVKFPWGNSEPNDTDYFPCNIWQGSFPHGNTKADGWGTTAPAKSFEPNGYGLYNMSGNVWEWTADRFRVKSLKKHVRKRLEAMRGFRVLKGGSFLCHRSYCYRYRIAARTGNSPDSTTSHQGFRIAWDR